MAHRRSRRSARKNPRRRQSARARAASMRNLRKAQAALGMRGNPRRRRARRNPSGRGAKRGVARRAVSTTQVSRSIRTHRGKPFQKLTGPRVTTVGGRRALKVFGKQQRGDVTTLKNLRVGDRVRVTRWDANAINPRTGKRGYAKDVDHFSVGGVRPRGNPSHRRRGGAKHRVVIHTAHGTKSFMARHNPSGHRQTRAQRAASMRNLRKARAALGMRSNPRRRRSHRSRRY